MVESVAEYATKSMCLMVDNGARLPRIAKGSVRVSDWDLPPW